MNIPHCFILPFAIRLMSSEGGLMPQSKQPRIVELEVSALSNKGHGLSWLDDEGKRSIQVEVPFTVPGDKVKVQLLKKSGGLYYSKLLEIITPSNQRVVPRCKHFGVCGGCRLQHIPYEQQLQHKESYVRRCFERVLSPDVAFNTILASPQPWNYRNKMDYTFLKKEGKDARLGLIQEGSISRIIEIEECHLANPWFIDALKAVKKWWQQENEKHSQIEKEIGKLQTLTLREGFRTGDRMVVLTVSCHPDFELQANKLEKFVEAMRQQLTPENPQSHLSIYLRIQQMGKGITTSMYEMLLSGPGHIREILNIKVFDDVPAVSLNFEIGPSNFFQPNPLQTERFYALALRMANIPRDAVVYDLYCGAGTLGLSIAKHVKQVIGIELSPESALSASNNAKRNGFQNVTIMSGAVRHALLQIPEKKLPPPDIVIVNPPRSGLDPLAIENVLALNAPKILYVSCNPVSQAKNIEYLMQKGYQLKKVQPVDQFPQTYQVENIAILEK